MQYHHPTNSFVVNVDALNKASFCLKWAIKNIRNMAGLPLEPHRNDGPMGSAQFAEQSILDAARDLGIHLGAERHGQLDVRNAP